MTPQLFNTADELRRAIGEGQISNKALQTITGIRGDVLTSYLEKTPRAGQALSPPSGELSREESTRLASLAAQITAGLQIDDDVRLRAIIETLTIQCHLTLQNIALLTRVGLEELERFVRDPESAPLEMKYELAVRASYLINAVANTTSRSS